jgi:hypothetical protein
VAAPVTVVFHYEQTVEGHASNISLGGMLVQCDATPQIGDAASLRIELPAPTGSTAGPMVVECEAQVVRTTGDPPRAAFRITTIDRDNLARLRTVIQELRLQTVVHGQIIPRVPLTPEQRRIVGAAILRWRAEQPQGTVQNFDTQAAGSLAAGQLPQSGVVSIAFWESAFDRRTIIESLAESLPADLIQDVILGGVSWSA